MNGHLTTTVKRPANRRASDAGRSRLVDNRRQRIASRRPLPRVSTTWLFGMAALVVAGAIAAALFGLPVRTWFDQDNELQALEHELTEMQAVNHDLEGEVDRLQTDDGIREAAREELGHIQSGDKRQTMLDLPPLPTDLPDGWPYSQIEAVMALRVSVAAPATSDAATSTPTTTMPTTTTTTTTTTP
jgi:Septum formation initiator